MFVGHYGPSFAANATKKSIPLWMLFLAVQLLDVFWAFFVLLGIEKVRVIPGFTATNPLDLYYMPYTHSLPGAIFWSALAGIGYRFFRRKEGWPAAGLIGGAVFSHWVLDLLVHSPDLPLYDNTLKVGFGLWNFPVAAFLLEIIFLFGGMYLYFQATRPVVSGGRYGMVIFGLAMLLVQASVFFGPPPPSDHAVAMTALFSYTAFAGVAYWLERKRV
jgi:hypothetical protein